MLKLSKKQVSYLLYSKLMALLLKKHTLKVDDCYIFCKLRGYGLACVPNCAGWCISFLPDSQFHTTYFPMIKLLRDLADNCHAFTLIFHKCLLTVQWLDLFHLPFLQEGQSKTKLQVEVRLLKIFFWDPLLCNFYCEWAIDTCQVIFFLLSCVWFSCSKIPHW